MNTAARRLSIFKKYATNLSILAKSQNWKVGNENKKGEHVFVEDDLYVCPLCHQFFNIDSLNQNSLNPLTLEDIPPKKVGGRPLVLTCKECNNKSGLSLDHHISSLMAWHSFADGESYIVSKLTIGKNNPFRGSMRFNSEEKTFTLQFPKKNPYAQRQFTYLNKEAPLNTQIGFSIRRGNPNKAALGLLRIGHLLAFYRFGYSYLFSKGAYLILSIINQDELGNGTQPMIVNDQNFLKGNDGFILFEKPNNLGSMLVAFTLKYKITSKSFGVVIPGLYEKHCELFKTFNSSGPTDSVVQLLNDTDFIESPILYFQMWDELDEIIENEKMKS